MAIVQYGAIITGMRGSIGGMTLSKAFSAQTARRKPRPPIPRRALQVAKKNQMNGLAPGWRNLTTTQRNDWAAWANSVTFLDSLGQSYKITGFNAWIRYRMLFLPTDATYSNNGPAAFGFFPGYGPTYDFNAGNIRLTGFAAAMIAGDLLFLTVWRPTFRTRNVPPGITFTRTKLSGVQAPPVTIASGIVTGLQSGSVVRVFIDSTAVSVTGVVNTPLRDFVDVTVP